MCRKKIAESSSFKVTKQFFTDVVFFNVLSTVDTFPNNTGYLQEAVLLLLLLLLCPISWILVASSETEECELSHASKLLPD